MFGLLMWINHTSLIQRQNRPMHRRCHIAPISFSSKPSMIVERVTVNAPNFTTLRKDLSKPVTVFVKCCHSASLDTCHSAAVTRIAHLIWIFSFQLTLKWLVLNWRLACHCMRLWKEYPKVRKHRANYFEVCQILPCHWSNSKVRKHHFASFKLNRFKFQKHSLKTFLLTPQTKLSSGTKVSETFQE